MARVRPQVSRLTVRRLRDRRGAALTRMLRLTSAAVAAYLVALWLLSDPRPLVAPLTALLIVQVTLVGTLTDTIRRILSVLAGVAVAITFSTFVGLSWWSLGLLVAASIVVGQMLRLGPHLLEVPISAMLVLGVGAAETVAWGRITETVVGAVIGLLVNLLFPPAVQTRSAGAAVEEYARQMAALLDRVADEVLDDVTAEQAARWLEEARQLANAILQLDEVLAGARESRRLNPRAVGTADTGPDLRSGADALEHSAVALRGMYRSLTDRVRQSDGQQPWAVEVREVFAVVLHDLAAAVRDFGALVRAEADEADVPEAQELAAALESAGETRARLTELLLVDVAAEPYLWQLHGAFLAAVERVLRELDVEERARQRERHRRESADEATAATVAARRLRTATQSMTDAVTELPRRRRR